MRLFFVECLLEITGTLLEKGVLSGAHNVIQIVMKLGFIHYNGGLHIDNSLLNVVLHD